MTPFIQKSLCYTSEFVTKFFAIENSSGVIVNISIKQIGLWTGSEILTFSGSWKTGNKIMSRRNWTNSTPLLLSNTFEICKN